MKTQQTRLDLLLEYFEMNPSREIPVAECVDWATIEWKKRIGGNLRYASGGLRRLYQKREIVRTKRGVYRYGAGTEKRRIQTNVKCDQFSVKSESTGKLSTPRADNRKAGEMNFHQQHESKCEVCGLGATESVAVYSEFFKLNPESENSEFSLTLCAIHRCTTGNVYDLIGMAFEHILEMNAVANLVDDNQFQSFTDELLSVGDKHEVNHHGRTKSH